MLYSAVTPILLLLGVAFFNYLLVEKYRNMGQGMSISTKIRLMATAVQLVIGIGLLLGSNGLAGAMNIIRQAGLKNRDDE